MTFDNVAYLFDTSILGNEKKDSVYGALAFVGNSLYISSYAEDTFRNFDFASIEETGFPEWIKSSENNEMLFNFLIKVYDDVDKLGISSFFIEKEYSVFIYLMGLIVTSIRVTEPDFRTHLDSLYYAYQSVYGDGIRQDSIEETVIVFNQRIRHLIQTQKEHHYFKTLLSENGHNLKEQISVLKLLERNNEGDFMVADYFFYAKQMVENFKKDNVHDIYATHNAAKRFTKATNHFFKSNDVKLNITSQHDLDYEKIYRFAHIILMASNYFVNKILDVSNSKNIDEIDKYLFVIMWMILHGGDNNMFINGRSNELIKELFSSLKKNMDIE